METGGVGEDCLSARAFVVCEREFRSRQFSRAAQGSPKGRRTGGRLLWVTFLGGARKVTSRRAAPGELDVDVLKPYGAKELRLHPTGRC